MPVNSALSAPPVKKIGRTVIPVTDENGNYRFPCPSPPPIIVSHRTASAFHTNSPGPSAASRLSRGGSEAGLSRTTSVTLSSILNFTARLSLSSRLGESSLLFPSSSSAAAATEQQGRTEEMETETTEVSFEEVTLYCEETEENSDSPTQRGMDTLHCDSQWHEETGRTGVEEQTEAHPQSHPEAGSAFCLLDFLNDDAWRDRRDRRASLMKKKAKEKKKREREGLEFWARCLENMD
uniref:Uncharacterized protein n=1 Tax=Chromera velia CCMP2878 TaxID=1169474 RepID=A0A0G4FPX2_9ALVE|eukprot:Cvel_18062.t1-p1 / transcript=Cvel_18062.t1 / gene=Cvel_18062 / organism=Chromera_velia_CCMP2878 / gene_product=hypothetical protein / transcript_product=hypothetical protein / location=Cvel_scaffold1476:41609-42316(-) / protein_length=236 / sequence_SO=supercontig / SO=protein_coding / is_pseudo=false